MFNINQNDKVWLYVPLTCKEYGQNKIHLPNLWVIDFHGKILKGNNDHIDYPDQEVYSKKNGLITSYTAKIMSVESRQNMDIINSICSSLMLQFSESRLKITFPLGVGWVGGILN